MTPRGNLIITSKADPFPSTTELQHFRHQTLEQNKLKTKKKKKKKESIQTNQIICPVVLLLASNQSIFLTCIKFDDKKCQ